MEPFILQVLPRIGLLDDEKTNVVGLTFPFTNWK